MSDTGFRLLAVRTHLRLKFTLVEFNSLDGNGCQFLQSATVSMALCLHSTGYIANIYATRQLHSRLFLVNSDLYHKIVCTLFLCTAKCTKYEFRCLHVLCKHREMVRR